MMTEAMPRTRMTFILLLLLLVLVSFLPTVAYSAQEQKGKGVRYRKAKKINFEALLIEGQIKRPDIAVVTGNVGDDVDGLLRLRENFHDQMAIEAGEDVK